jgi:flagellin
MLAIKNNIMAANAARYLGRSYDALAQSVERLSSGLRINSAKDDAAGMAVRELMRSDVAVMQQGSRNALDGISMLQITEGAMQTIDNILTRMKQLAEQASTDLYSDDQRSIMNNEFVEVSDEIQRIANSVGFNGIVVLNNTTDITIRFGTGADDKITVTGADMTKAGLGIDAGLGAAEYVGGATGVADPDADWVTGTGAETFAIQFDVGGLGEEALIETAAFAAQAYSMNEVADMINAASRAASDYNAAEVVHDVETDQYRLKISAEAGGLLAPTITSDFADGTGLGGADFLTVDGVAGGVDNILTTTDAESALATVDAAIVAATTARATFGAKMNRLENSVELLSIQTENLMAAESRISDVDVATEMATLTRTQVLAQAGTAMLAQANTMPQMALTLLR